MDNKSNKKVAAVVTTFNRGKKIKLTVDSILKQSQKVSKLIVVDDGSTDSKHLENLKDNRLKIKHFKSNKGVVWARNYGISELLEYDYLLFVDDDIIIDENSVGEMCKAFEDPDVVAVMPVVYFFSDKNKVWSAGSGVDCLTGKTIFYVDKPSSRFQSIEAATSIIMVKTSVILKHGWYDPTYYFCYEDADFYYRLRSGGGKIVCASRAKGYHDIPLDLSLDRVAKRSYHIARGRVLFLSKFGTFFPINLLFVLGFSIYYQYLGIVHKDFLSGFRYLLGVYDGLALSLKSGKDVYTPKVVRNISEEDMFSPPRLRSDKVRQ